MKKDRILVVDDEAIIRRMLGRVLTDEGYVVDVVESGMQALEKFKIEHYDLVITDLKMPGIEGLELLEKLKIISPLVEVIIITGYPTTEAHYEAMKLGAADFICKPFDLGELLSTVEKCLLK